MDEFYNRLARSHLAGSSDTPPREDEIKRRATKLRIMRTQGTYRKYREFNNSLKTKSRLIFSEFIFFGFCWSLDVSEFLRIRGYERDIFNCVLSQSTDRRVALYMVMTFTTGRIGLPKDLGKKLMEFLIVL
jgi:hypothetical protein